MKKVIEPVRAKSNFKLKPIMLTIIATLFFIFVFIPLFSLIFDGSKSGNVALIPIYGVITTEGTGSFASATISSSTVINFIKEAERNSNIKVILLEINSPGGTPVATEEIAEAVKSSSKPVIALICEVGASGGYWVASAADYIIASRMSITGSIGVLSSYLEFSDLMKNYGVGYERLVAGEYKDTGIPYRKLTPSEENLIQTRINKLHDIFIAEVAVNRNIPEEEVRQISTGEVFLGLDALSLGLIDQIGNRDTAEKYLLEKYLLPKVEFLTYAKKSGFFELLIGSADDFSVKIGEGIGSVLFKQGNQIMI